VVVTSPGWQRCRCSVWWLCTWCHDSRITLRTRWGCCDKDVKHDQSSHTSWRSDFVNLMVWELRSVWGKIAKLGKFMLLTFIIVVADDSFWEMSCFAIILIFICITVLSVHCYTVFQILLTQPRSAALFVTWLSHVSLGDFNFWLSLSLSLSLSETFSWMLKSVLRPKFNLTSV